MPTRLSKFDFHRLTLRASKRYCILPLKTHTEKAKLHFHSLQPSTAGDISSAESEEGFYMHPQVLKGTVEGSQPQAETDVNKKVCQLINKMTKYLHGKLSVDLHVTYGYQICDEVVNIIKM